MNRDCGPAAQFDSPLLVQNITVAFKTKSQSRSSEDGNVMFSYHIIIPFIVRLESPPARQCIIIPSHSQMHFKFSIILIIYLSAVEIFNSEEYPFFFSILKVFVFSNVECSTNS